MPDADLQAVQASYNRWAAVYDRIATAPGVRSWRERAAETLDPAVGETVVEMGCGTGANLPHLRERVGSPGRVLGIDVVPGMLAQAQRRIDSEGWPNVHAVRADAATPPVSAVDGVLSTFLVGMLPDPGAAVRRWIVSVRPGGRITLLNAGRTDRLFARPGNLVLRAFVRATAPGNRTARRAPIRSLEDRWAAARDAVFEGTVDHVEATLGGGFVKLASGRVPET